MNRISATVRSWRPIERILSLHVPWLGATAGLSSSAASVRLALLVINTAVVTRRWEGVDRWAVKVSEIRFIRSTIPHFVIVEVIRVRALKPASSGIRRSVAGALKATRPSRTRMASAIGISAAPIKPLVGRTIRHRVPIGKIGHTPRLLVTPVPATMPGRFTKAFAYPYGLGQTKNDAAR